MQRKGPRQLRLSDFTIDEMICLMRSWHPGFPAPTRWKTWGAYLADSDALRVQLMSDPTIRKVYGGLEPFAVRLRRELAAMPGAVYDSHNHPPPYPYPALWHAHVHYPGDDHVHDDPRDDVDDGDIPPVGERAREATLA
jgi:hypothetical protein